MRTYDEKVAEYEGQKLIKRFPHKTKKDWMLDDRRARLNSDIEKENGKTCAVIIQHELQEGK